MRTKLLILTGILCGLIAQAQDDTAKNLPIKKGYYNQTELGVGLGKSRLYNSNSGQITALTFNGYRFTPRLIPGVIVGVDWYSGELVVPIGIGLRGDLLKNQKATPYYGLDVAYGSTWFNHEADNQQVKGGLMLNPMIGFRVHLGNGTALVMSTGYKYQRTSITQDYGEITGWGTQYVQTVKNYNRFIMRIGVSF